MTFEEYQQAKAMLAEPEDPDDPIPDEDRSAAQAAIEAYENQNLQGWAGAGPDKFAGQAPVPGGLGLVGVYGQGGAGGAGPDPATLQDKAQTAGVREQLDQARAVPPVAPEPDPVLSLNRHQDLLAQGLALQPATTHVAGDKAAEQEWVSSAGENARGAVFAYEPPLAIVKKRFMEDPAFSAAIYPESPPRPEEIMAMETTDAMYQKAADLYWRETADGAAKAGKTAYRYSKAPWLHGDGAVETIRHLGMQALGGIKPASEGINAFVMGVDDTGAFGALRAGQETANPEVTEPNELLGIDSAGGIPTADAKTRNQLTIDEHPVLHTLGQGVGALAPWGAANKVFNFVAGGVKRVAGPAAGVAKRLASSAAAGATASSAVQAGQEGVDAATSWLQTGDTGTTFQAAGERVLDAAPIGLGLGTVSGAIPELATGGRKAINSRFRGMPQRLEDSGGATFSVRKGPQLSPQTEAVIEAADLAGNRPGDVIAKQIAPDIKRAADIEVKAVIEEVGQRKQEFFASSEGKQRLPLTNGMEKAAEVLRRKHQPTDGDLKAATDKIAKIKGFFNLHVGGVSTTPKPGAIKLSAEEAETFLSRVHQKKLLPKKGKQAPGGTREIDPGDLESSAPVDEEEGLALSLRRRGIKDVYVMPERYDALRHETILNDLKWSQTEAPGARELNEVDKALRVDRDARTAGGVKGGWSALQGKHAELLEKQKKLESLAVPGGDSFNVLAGSVTSKPGELLTQEALGGYADKAGPEVAKQYKQLRLLDPLIEMRNRANYRTPDGKGNKSFFNDQAGIDALSLRAWPVLRKLEGPTLRTGQAARAGLPFTADRPPPEEEAKQ